MRIIKPYRPYATLESARLFARKYHPVSHIIQDGEGFSIVLDFKENDKDHIALLEHQQKNPNSERWVFDIPEKAIVEDIIP